MHKPSHSDPLNTSSIDSLRPRQALEWSAITAILADFMVVEHLPDDFSHLAQCYYFPLAQRIARDYGDFSARTGRPQLLGINGAQGTGKSTLAALLKRILEEGAGLRCAILSIDDVYLTRAERKKLADSIHPLLQTRGVPGTHDLSLALDVLAKLKDASEQRNSHIAPAIADGDVCFGEPSVQQKTSTILKLPRFDKACDDRKPDAEWFAQQAPVDIILFEGWCVAARPQSETDLIEPINKLEAEEDTKGIWRGYVNNSLASTYQTLFSQLDGLIMIKAPSMMAVGEWRWEQEQKLISRSHASAHSQLMNRTQIERFIQHYERLTRHILTEMPARADLVFHLDNEHAITQVSGLWSQDALFRAREG